jgi:hypothetical protein
LKGEEEGGVHLKHNKLVAKREISAALLVPRIFKNLFFFKTSAFISLSAY